LRPPLLMNSISHWAVLLQVETLVCVGLPQASGLGRGAASRRGHHSGWDPGEQCARADSQTSEPRERPMERLHINDVIALSEGELRRNAITLQTEIPENPPPVVVDPVLLQQVVVNLIMNAIKAMRSASDRAGTLRIRTQEQPSGSIVALVQDSTVGVDLEHLSRLFHAAD
jgi:light-regulated signal transduction histidine kinase (bacteriophytochrome)